MDYENEVWKDIPGHEGIYQASNFGRIKSLERIDRTKHRWRERIMKFSHNKRGYWQLTIGGRKYLVHRLVLMAFVGIRDDMQCNHINGNKKDNRLENLEYCTGKENMRHARDILGIESGLPKGEKHWSSKLTEDDVREMRRLYSTGQYSYPQLGKIYGVSYPAARSVVIRETWKNVL